jgi:F-type H+-transporting ATPase subunit b
MEQTRRDIEQETRRSIEQIRREVADLTVLATEKVTRKSLDDEDHRRLIDEALSEFDFEALAPSSGGHSASSGNGKGSGDGDDD